MELPLPASDVHESERIRGDEKLANFPHFFSFFVLPRTAAEGEMEARVGIEPA
jgi:hypothetical protein